MDNEKYIIKTQIIIVVKFKKVEQSNAYFLSYCDSEYGVQYLNLTYKTDSYLTEYDKQFVQERQELVNTLPTEYYKYHPLHKALWFGFIENIQLRYNIVLKWDQIENMHFGIKSEIKKYEAPFSKLFKTISNFFTVDPVNKED